RILDMMTRNLVLATLLATAAPVHAASDAATRFGARVAIEQISLSPDGKRFVVLLADAKRGTRAMVYTIDSSELPLPLFASTGEKEQVDYCEWSS
ncbi:hypothetical protein ACO1MB_13800, partial [Staphylococcus aureus]